MRAVGTVLGVLGGLGLALASLGLYVVVAFAVSQRHRRLGPHGAGRAADTSTLDRLAERRDTARGVVTGLWLSWLSVRGAAAMLSSLSGGGVNLFAPTADLVTFVIVSVLMAAVGLAATLWPARRAAQADPLVALRHL